MCVPGATTSGFMRPSCVGPRPEKLMMSLALSAPAFVTPQPSVPESRTLSAAPDGDHVLRGARRGDAAVALVALRVVRVAVPVAVVAGGEDLDHLLVAGRARGRVAHQRVVRLRGHVVAAEVRDAPRVVRDPRPGGVGVGGELRVVHRGGRAAAAEDLRGAHLRVRRHAEAVLVALGVLPGSVPTPAAIEVTFVPWPPQSVASGSAVKSWA